MNALLAALLLAAPIAPAPADTVPLHDDLGALHREITTEVPLAQRYFDQGLRLYYAFNHAEAIASFERAAALDAGCAMCWWGVAASYGPNINVPMDSAGAAAAYAAVRQAAERSAGASEVEKGLIAALETRYASAPDTPQAPRDSAYARAMGELAARFPDDVDVATLHAEALMDLSPWYYWERDGTPRPDTETILSALSGAMAAAPDHPGACHFWIHAVEAARPADAVACAERLAALMPGAGHLVHMPGHIYIRVGRYADAITANEHAVHADESFIADRAPSGVYPAAYYPHNYHFMAFAALLAGREETALMAAERLRERVAPELVEQIYFLEQMPAYPQLMRVSFGHWEDVLADSRPDERHVTGVGLDAYARGVALAATGRCDEAGAELERVRDRAAARQSGADSPGKGILPTAEHVLAGEIAMRCGDPAGAVEHFQIAVDMEDALLYEEPPLWYYPARWSLGRALLEAGRAADAEAVYLREMAIYPDNVWSLAGLAAALEAQGKTEEAAAARERLARAAEGGGIVPEASRL